MIRFINTSWIVSNVTLLMTSFVLWIFAAVNQGPGYTGERFGGVAGAFLAAAAVSLISWGIWQEDRKIPPRLPRAERKQLAREQARINLDAAIRKLEVEAGIRPMQIERDEYRGGF